MKTETTIQGLTASLAPARTTKKLIGFVPTMGNLHEGHLTLVRAAKKICDVVVVSIFVNPIQFGAGEDFDSYPRTLEQDSRLLADVGCDIIFAPSVDQMYGKQPRLTNISVSQITNDLCGKSRPGHFDGVGTIVKRLFEIIKPNKAYFGEKDFQQLQIVKKLVTKYNMPVEVIGCPIGIILDILECEFLLDRSIL
jgi:pantoate--beta-alanine ligase